jgi:hypothetical protein
MVIMGQKGYTEEQFIQLAKTVNPHYTVVGEFVNTSTKILVKCKHSEREIYAWQLLKPRKYCCPNAYHINRTPAQLKDIAERKAEILNIFEDKIDPSNAEYNNSRDKIINLRCKKHDIIFDKWVSSLMAKIGCPECHKEINKPKWQQAAALGRQSQIKSGRARFISKGETKWLDELNVANRQHWLEDVKYSVDGFDPVTNTVYLYHGKFWHGCPKSFDPEEVHPILKIKMKQLYKQTIDWENKIIQAGYNLVIKWGK